MRQLIALSLSTAVALASLVSLPAAAAGNPNCDPFTGAGGLADMTPLGRSWGAGQTFHERDQMLEGPGTATDPRANGWTVMTLSIDYSPGAHMAVLRGPWELTTAQGSWRGRIEGTVAPDWFHVMRVVATGSGDYDGLRLRLTVTGWLPPFDLVGEICG